MKWRLLLRSASAKDGSRSSSVSGNPLSLAPRKRRGAAPCRPSLWFQCRRLRVLYCRTDLSRCSETQGRLSSSETQNLFLSSLFLLSSDCQLQMQKEGGRAEEEDGSVTGIGTFYIAVAPTGAVIWLLWRATVMRRGSFLSLPLSFIRGPHLDNNNNIRRREREREGDENPKPEGEKEERKGRKKGEEESIPRQTRTTRFHSGNKVAFNNALELLCQEVIYVMEIHIYRSKLNQS